ncbi:MAG: tetratricopeptide repeat protein [Phycisphaeraceae bacterium]|nr:tetratricopeptide repeat protein [Phycisphaeraceae bacterium]
MPSKQKSRALFCRSTLAKLAVALCATLLALGAAETLVRGFGMAPALKPIQLSDPDCVYKRSTNAILGFELKANTRNDNPDFIATYERTNSHGQRDRERTVQKPDGVTRIILLGDSVVEGYGLREADTLSSQLEHLYANESIEVLNFGVSAYCTRAEVELLKVKALQFDPDVVVLVFVENDFDNFNREAFALEEAIHRPALAKALFRQSHLFRLTCIQLDLFHFRADADPVRWNQDAIGDNNVAQGLQQFRMLADRHGFSPLIAIWPRFLDDRIADVCFMPQGSDALVVEHLAAMHDIPSVRLSKFFRQRLASSPQPVNPRLQFSSGDELHPSSEGSRAAAEALKQSLANLDRDTTLATREITRSAHGDTKAVAAAKTLGQAQPNYARVHNRMGTQFLKTGELAKAVAEFKQALKAEPSHAGAHNNLGVAYERLGQNGAQAQFEQAIRSDPNFTQAHFNLARTLMRTGRDTNAIAELQRTIQINPDHVGALNMLGTAFGKQQRFTEAQSVLEHAVRLDPNHAEAHSNLGAAYAGQGLLREAVAQFEAALQIDPTDPEAKENLKRVKAAMSE